VGIRQADVSGPTHRVNSELDALRDALPPALDALTIDGRMW